jgi:phosphatidylserine/phosphatidylglycerophosphate/cardiolipin synthase-like enzyme
VKRFAAAVLALFAAGSVQGQACGPAAQEKIQAAFSPWDDVEQVIIDRLASAEKQIRLQAFLFTSKRIASAVIEAHLRGVDVEILADANQGNSNASQLRRLSEAGIAIWLEKKYQNAHNKILLVDAETAMPVVMTGSYNLTWAAQRKNAENLVVISGNSCLASQFLTNWERHRQDATAYRK